MGGKILYRLIQLVEGFKLYRKQWPTALNQGCPIAEVKMQGLHENVPSFNINSNINSNNNNNKMEINDHIPINKHK
jgi:hypothetical protein